ncbi:MAG TPA: flagellar biosynthetic protein FliO [Polyangiaceae bacterium]|nr:flagellar biosynthetic protein FliO [Polyangiaceae bacterium]
MTPRRQRILAALLVLFGGLFSQTLAFADEAPDASVTPRSWLAPRTTPQVSHPASGATVGVGRSLAVLALTGVLGGAALFLRQRKNKPARKSTAGLRVLSSTRVGHRAELVLAEVGGRKILLGVTESAVRKLGWIDADEQENESALAVQRPRLVTQGPLIGVRVQSDPEPIERPAGIGRSFREVLKDAIGGFAKPAADDSAASQLAGQTRDTFTRSQAKPASERRAPLMVDVEGQAQGLLARLKEPRA